MPNRAIGVYPPSVDHPRVRLQGFLLIFRALFPIFCLFTLSIGEMFLFMGTGIRDDVALLAKRPLFFLVGSASVVLIFLAVYLLICGWFYRGWRRFLRSEEGLAQLANPAAGFPWPGLPQPPGQMNTAQAMLNFGLISQILICADQALWAVSAAHHADALSNGPIRSFWLGIEIFRIGVAVAASGAVVALLFNIRRLREKSLIRRILVVAVSLLLLSGIGIAAVGVKLQLDNQVPMSVHMEVLHPHSRTG